MIQVQDLKPCLLIAARCSIHGGISYQHDKEQTDLVDGETEVSSWETTRTVRNREEYSTACGMRSKFGRELTTLGVPSVLGVIVNTDKEDEVRELISVWREKVREFNSGSRFSKIVMSAMVFKVQGENEEALEGMLYDLKDVLGALKSAIQAADYKGIRDVIARMKGFSTVLPDSAAEKLVIAAADARQQAKMIRRALEKQGESLESIQQQISTSSVDLAQFVIFGDVSDVDSGELAMMATENIAVGVAEQADAAIATNDIDEALDT